MPVTVRSTRPIPADMLVYHVGFPLVQRRRRWTNGQPTLVVSDGMFVIGLNSINPPRYGLVIYTTYTKICVRWRPLSSPAKCDRAFNMFKEELYMYVKWESLAFGNYSCLCVLSCRKPTGTIAIKLIFLLWHTVHPPPPGAEGKPVNEDTEKRQLPHVNRAEMATRNTF